MNNLYETHSNHNPQMIDLLVFQWNLYKFWVEIFTISNVDIIGQLAANFAASDSKNFNQNLLVRLFVV